MGSIARRAGSEPQLLGGLGQGGACPQCGFAWSREGVTGWDHGMLAGGIKGVGRRLPSIPHIMVGSRFPEKREYYPVTMALVPPHGGAVVRGPVPVAGSPQGTGGDGKGAQRAGLVGTLARFIAYLGDNGILADVEAPRGHHMLHLYAYIAKGLGMRLGYDFDFLETGAFSVELELDLFRLGIARGGTEPFGGDGRASAAFLGLVRDRGAKWLQAATFAMRERGRDGALEDFMAVSQGIIKYDPETVRCAFGEVKGAVRALGGIAP